VCRIKMLRKTAQEKEIEIRNSNKNYRKAIGVLVLMVFSAKPIERHYDKARGSQQPFIKSLFLLNTRPRLEKSVAQQISLKIEVGVVKALLLVVGRFYHYFYPV